MRLERGRNRHASYEHHTHLHHSNTRATQPKMPCFPTHYQIDVAHAETSDCVAETSDKVVESSDGVAEASTLTRLPLKTPRTGEIPTTDTEYLPAMHSWSSNQGWHVRRESSSALG